MGLQGSDCVYKMKLNTVGILCSSKCYFKKINFWGELTDLSATTQSLLQGRFIELAPWTSEVRWAVEPWGEWRMWAKSAQYEALIECRSDKDSGVVLRAPTTLEGLVPACKDTFYGAFI